MILRILLLTLTATIGTQAFGMQATYRLFDAGESASSTFNAAPVLTTAAIAVGTGALIYCCKQGALTSIRNEVVKFKNTVTNSPETISVLTGGTLGIATGGLSYLLQKYGVAPHAAHFCSLSSLVAGSMGISAYYKKNSINHNPRFLTVSALVANLATVTISKPNNVTHYSHYSPSRSGYEAA